MADVFISIPFSDDFASVSRSIAAATVKSHLTSYRTDQDHMSVEIASLIHAEIRQSRLVVADVTTNNPNVLHEIGMAQALDKPLILISQDPATNAAFNVRGRRVLEYSLDKLSELVRKLQLAFSEATTPSETLRAMLVPRSLENPTPESRFIIAASPLSWRRAVGRSGGYKKLRRTSSDYVGIRGIMQAFGLLYDFDTLPDNLDPEDCHDDVLNEKMNIYCIASPKANRWTGTLLNKLQQRWVPSLKFQASAKSENLRNVSLSIYHDGTLLLPPGWDVGQGDRYWRDFGLLVRAPSPYDNRFMVTILAGRSSLGTEAACTAFTDLKEVQKIRDGLRHADIDIEDHRQPFWALISMKRAKDDDLEEALRDSLTIERIEALRKS